MSRDEAETWYVHSLGPLQWVYTFILLRASTCFEIKADKAFL